MPRTTHYHVKLDDQFVQVRAGYGEHEKARRLACDLNMPLSVVVRCLLADAYRNLYGEDFPGGPHINVPDLIRQIKRSQK